MKEDALNTNRPLSSLGQNLGQYIPHTARYEVNSLTHTHTHTHTHTQSEEQFTSK